MILINLKINNMYNKIHCPQFNERDRSCLTCIDLKMAREKSLVANAPNYHRLPNGRQNYIVLESGSIIEIGDNKVLVF